MNKSDLVKRIEEKKTFVSQEDIKLSIDLILSFITETLRSSGRVEVRNFGTFSIRTRNERISRNPKTGEKIFTPEKKSINFKMSKELFEAINEK